MIPCFHLSVDDVFDCLLNVSDWQLDARRHPFFSFCGELVAAGAIMDLYVFQQARRPDGRVRRLDQITDASAAVLRELHAIRFGPHARDYTTPPYAQPAAELVQTMESMFRQIDRFTTPEQRSRWLRLHYFSECIESAGLWREHGVDALLTTDREAVCYTLPPESAAQLRTRGWVAAGPTMMIRSHFRLESFVAEADDPPRFLDRLDTALEQFGFVTMFTHEDDMADPRVRALARASVNHLVRRGIPAS